MIFSRPNRSSITELSSTEKTHLGTAVELCLMHVLRIPKGSVMDCNIDNVEVDIKFSISEFGWMIPNEAVGHICLLVSLIGELQFNVGLVRITREILSPGKGNRDQKKSILAKHRENIFWLVRKAFLPANPISLLPPDIKKMALEMVEVTALMQRVLAKTVLCIQEQHDTQALQELSVSTTRVHATVDAALTSQCELKLALMGYGALMEELLNILNRY